MKGICKNTYVIYNSVSPYIRCATLQCTVIGMVRANQEEHFGKENTSLEKCIKYKNKE
ncbi:hypothetical protein EhV18_00261 [Emiliania huxleyi virus 18]|nr:hypothetical protein EhV18_00261 [Emiliania huxleyi virus 18]AHA55357.1 hypothetical protein EhV156_00261 [Emiliania huxleyi virus 156]